jgi:polyisoprenoid-binding protein YceI
MGLHPIISVLLASTLAAAPAVDDAPNSILNKQYVRIDPFHSVLSFSVTHFGFTKVRGNFDEWSGYILWDKEDVTRSSFTIVVKTGTVNTGLERRDDDLRSDQFFDVERFPTAIFQSTRIVEDGEGLVAYGNLTIRDVTKEVAIPFRFLGTREFGPGFGRIFASGRLTIGREEFGLTNAKDRVARSLAVVSDEVELEIEIQGAAIDPVALPFNSREKPSIGEQLATVVEDKGADAAVERFHYLMEQDPEAYNFSSSEILKLSHRLRAEGATRDAIKMAELAVDIDEKAARDAYISLAAAYATDGDTSSAAEQVKKMLVLDEYDALALELIRHLEAG